MIIENENLTTQIKSEDEITLLSDICQKYDDFNTIRNQQLTDITLVKNAIYNSHLQGQNGWNSRIELPDIYELAQTLKSHLMENLYSNPSAMFDVEGTTPQTQEFANRQKAMLVNTFEAMNIENEFEKIVDSIVETGECTLFVGWETRIKQVRRAKTPKEQMFNLGGQNFVLEDKVVYDNAKIKYIKPEDFVFDKTSKDNWELCPKIYRTFRTLDDIFCDKSNNFLTKEKLENLKGVVAKRKHRQDEDKGYEGNRLEILEYWGDIELTDGTVLKNRLVTVAGRREIIRLEANPFVINPFIHANIIENPSTGRGISPLRVALILNELSSTILNKQIDALALMMNPPYLAPKGCFKGQQDVRPGKIIEYDAALMTTAPSPLSFDKAMQGWDFLNYFKSTIESATGIFKNMAGNLQASERTATELNYSVNGQEARLNMILDSINRKIIIPMVEKTAEIISNFKLGDELIRFNNHGKTFYEKIDDNVRNANYIYRYGDRKASFERKMRLKEMFEVVKSFTQIQSVSEKIDWLECFKFALEQYGIENSENFLLNSK